MGHVDDKAGKTAPAPAGPDALLSVLIDLTDDAVISCDAGSTVTFFSDSAERLFGQRSQEIMGRSVRTLFPGHWAEAMDRLFATVSAGECIRHFESEIVRPDGLPVPVSLSLAPLPHVSDSPASQGGGWVMVARDVTEQRLAQATMAEIDVRLEEGEALSHVGSWLWDLRTGAVQWSLEFHRMHDLDPLDFAGTFEAYMDLIASQDRDVVRTAMQQSVRMSRPLDLEYRIVNADDKLRIIRVVATPTVGSDGMVVGLRGIGHDVTNRSGPRPGAGGPA
ncbi:MAG TPA: PAS domain S-box protein [Acidimicrobiales bacterium]|nr:PAS domain S-box protein [Acidimicrobiales bacterium]